MFQINIWSVLGLPS